MRRHGGARIKEIFTVFSRIGMISDADTGSRTTRSRSLEGPGNRRFLVRLSSFGILPLPAPSSFRKTYRVATFWIGR